MSVVACHNSPHNSHQRSAECPNCPTQPTNDTRAPCGHYVTDICTPVIRSPTHAGGKVSRHWPEIGCMTHPCQRTGAHMRGRRPLPNPTYQVYEVWEVRQEGERSVCTTSLPRCRQSTHGVRRGAGSRRLRQTCRPGHKPSLPAGLNHTTPLDCNEQSTTRTSTFLHSHHSGFSLTQHPSQPTHTQTHTHPPLQCSTTPAHLLPHRSTCLPAKRAPPHTTAPITELPLTPPIPSHAIQPHATERLRHLLSSTHHPFASAVQRHTLPTCARLDCPHPPHPFTLLPVSQTYQPHLPSTPSSSHLPLLTPP